MNRPSIGKTNNLSFYDQIDKEQVTAVKAIRYERDSESYYDLLGHPVLTPVPGQLYIRNGRKYYYHP